MNKTLTATCTRIFLYALTLVMFSIMGFSEWNWTRSGLMQVARILPITTVSFFILEHIHQQSRLGNAFLSMAHNQKCKQWHLDQWDLWHRAQPSMKYHSSNSMCHRRIWSQHCTGSGSAAREHPAVGHLNKQIQCFTQLLATCTYASYIALQRVSNTSRPTNLE